MENLVLVFDKIEDLTYKLALPPASFGVQNGFHVFMLRKHILDLSYMMELAFLRLKEHLSYDKCPLRTVDRKEQVLSR